MHNLRYTHVISANQTRVRQTYRHTRVQVSYKKGEGSSPSLQNPQNLDALCIGLLTSHFALSDLGLYDTSLFGVCALAPKEVGNQLQLLDSQMCAWSAIMLWDIIKVVEK